MDNIINLIKNNIIDDFLYHKIKKTLNEISIEDIKKYVKFSDENYQRNYVHNSDKFDIIVICWKAGQKTEIHDHPDYCCLLKVLDGKLTEDIYFNTNGLEYVSTNVLNTGDIANKKGSRIVHKIIAVEDSISLHIYIPGKYKPIYFI